MLKRHKLFFENLEDRALLSSGLASRSAHIGPISSIKTDPAAVAAITQAFNGGLGSEWAALIHREVRNPFSVIAGFVSHRYTSYTVPGVVARTPAVQPLFTGAPYDQLLPTVAAAAVFKHNVLELAAILRGPFQDPQPSYYTFALDRGAHRAPTFASRPGITSDALVTIAVGPYGSAPTGTIQDLANGSTQTIDPAAIKIQGATLRIFLDTSQFPSRGATLAKYRFALWTSTQPGADLTHIPSFASDAMTPIAVLKDITATR